MGRSRKPVAILKLNGTYRPDRHGDRFQAPAATMECPASLSKDARKIWASTIDPLIKLGAVLPHHVELCISACNAGVVLRKLEQRVAALEELDYKTQIQLTTASATFTNYMRRLGATPTDGVKLNAKSVEAAPQGVSASARKRG